MILYRKQLILFLLFFECLIVSAQTYNFKNYNIEQGLPQSQILSIFQDHKGYMWFGTNGGGAARFDGNEMSVFNSGKGLLNNVVFAITENSNHDVLFGTSEGLSIYDGINFKNYGVNEGLSNSLIYSLVNDGNKLWIGTQEGVYVLLNSTVTTFLKDTLLAKSTVYSIFKDKIGNIWFGTNQNGVFCFEKEKQIVKHYRLIEADDFNVVFSITQLINNDLLISSQKGLFKIDSEGKLSRVLEIPRSENVSFTALLPTKANELYYGTQSEGLNLFSFKTNSRIAVYHRNNGLTNAEIKSLYKDDEGNLWVGTDGSGVYKYYNDKFTYFNKTNGLKENYISTVFVDSDNNIWAGLKNAGLIKIAGNKIETFQFNLSSPNDLPDNNINCSIALDNGAMLFGTADGLCLFDKGKFKTITENDFRHKYILSLYRDKKGVIWIGTPDGLYKMVDNKPVEVKELEKFKQPGIQFPIYFITENDEGQIWFSSTIHVYSLEDDVVKQYVSKKDKTGYISSGVIDYMNNLWLGTEYGVFLFQDNEFISLSKTNNFSSTAVNFLQLDKEKGLYVGTNVGLDIIDIKNYYKNQFSYEHLGKDDGLLSIESNFNASAIDRDGKILIGTINGLEIYNPYLSKINEKEARVSVVGVKLFYGQEDVTSYSNGLDSVSLLPKQLVLPFNKNNLTFSFVGICLVGSEKVVYQYKVEGLDKEWTPPSHKMEVTYPSLPPGTYTFMVKAMNNDGIWNKQPATFMFTILSPWYRTWWFYVLCIVAVISSALLYNNYRTRKLKLDKLHLENIVEIRTKEVRIEKEKVEQRSVEIANQKHIIEEKHKEITDSINYAERIQRSLLATKKILDENLRNYFILFKPKDVVSGDFYWANVLDDEKFLLLTADSTGHGVPGAIMSIVNIASIKEAIVNGHKSVEKILDETRKIIIDNLKNDGSKEGGKDGMDGSLICFDFKNNILTCACANNPVWIIRNKELIEIKADRMPIGKHENDTISFSLKTMELKRGDLIYAITDGFADQFGGHEGKKYKGKNLQSFLLSISNESMDIQKQKLNEEFNKWKGDLDQIDDVTLVGVRI